MEQVQALPAPISSSTPPPPQRHHGIVLKPVFIELRETERNQRESGTSIGHLLHTQLGIKPAACARALTRNQTGDISARGTTLDQLSNTGQGEITRFERDFTLKLLEDGVRGRPKKGQRKPWLRWTRREPAWLQLPGAQGAGCSSCRRCWAPPVQHSRVREGPQARASPQPSSAAMTAGRRMVCVTLTTQALELLTHNTGSGTSQPGTACSLQHREA